MKDTTDIPRTTPDSVEGRPDALASVEGWAGSVVRKKSGVRSPGASWASVEGVISPLGPTWIEEDRADNFSLYSRYAGELTAEFGTPFYTRIDAPATPEQKARLQKLSPETVKESKLAGEPITAKLTRAPGNNAPVGGLKVVAASGWFAARPSGTENIYKIYVESFRDQAHLNAIVSEAQVIVSNALNATDPDPRQAEERP